MLNSLHDAYIVLEHGIAMVGRVALQKRFGRGPRAYVATVL